MLTIKPFSTISYNTPEFLKKVLDDMVKRGVLDFYAFIQHFPEDDETKKHIHLFCIPSMRIDTCSWCEEFLELEKDNTKPLGVIRPRSSKFIDWYLYAIHDRDYLITKFETRKYHYSDEDIIVSDIDYFNELKHTSYLNTQTRQTKILGMLSQGVDLNSLIVDGVIPIQQLGGYVLASEFMNGNRTFRGGRRNHEEDEVELPFKE